MRAALPPLVVLAMLALFVGGLATRHDGWVWLAFAAPLVLLALVAEALVAEWRGAASRMLVAWTAGWATLLWLGPALLFSPLAPLILALAAVVPIYGATRQPLSQGPVAQAWRASASRFRDRPDGSVRAQLLGFAPVLAGLVATSFGLLGVGVGSVGAMSLATLHPNAIYAGPILMMVGVALLLPTVFVLLAPFVAPLSDPPGLRRLRATMGIEGGTRWDASTAFLLAIVDASLLAALVVWVILMGIGLVTSGATSPVCLAMGATGALVVSARNVAADIRLFAPVRPARSVLWAVATAPRAYAEANLWESTVLMALVVPTLLAFQAAPVVILAAPTTAQKLVVVVVTGPVAVLWAGLVGRLTLRLRVHRAQLVHTLAAMS